MATTPELDLRRDDSGDFHYETDYEFDAGVGELTDAARVLDYLESINDSPRLVWVAGYSFGAWICLQLLMRRPEIDGFLAIAPPANHYDLSFLAPCPASGLVIHGDLDQVAPPDDVERAVDKIRTQKGMVVERAMVPGANHFFREHLTEMEALADKYLERRMKDPPRPQPQGRR